MKHQLGATLYIPATRPNIAGTLNDPSLGLRSAVVCLEDSVAERDVAQARVVFAQFLSAHQRPDIARVYVRPRDMAMLAWMMSLPNIDKVDGFVLPKVTTDNLGQWLSILIHGEHSFMPTVEGVEAFDVQALQALRNQLMPFASRVDAVRIGGNDILNLLGARRSRERTAYDGPLASVIRDFAGVFIPHGYTVSSPVFEHYSEEHLLREEVERDLEHGLTTKTAIHPQQVRQIHDLYRPTAREVREAQAILEEQALAVFGSSGSMCEPATHRSWAEGIIARAQTYGIKSDNDQIPRVA